jgi:cyclopropane fatty-acyl-phospholipid synthase-like methyltransferase
MQERHQKREKYFEEQAFTSGNYVIPFIESIRKLEHGTSVLEVGCGEGGNLKPFLDMGCKVTGVDILEPKISNAKKFFEKHELRKNLTLIASDIYDPPRELEKKFDLIIMRDVLEHIHDQEKFMNYIKSFLKPEGLFFLGFPPWQNPFGGHQQMCYSKFLSKLPWFHLLPGRLYPGLMKIFSEPESRIQDLLEIRQTRITIERFQRIIKREKYPVIKRTFWFINPNYKIKFGLKPRQMNRVISDFPGFRNFFITTCYYILGAPSR